MFTADMFNSNEALLNLFADSIFAHLNVSQTTGGHVVRPVNSSFVVVEDWYRFILGESVKELKILEDVGKLLNAFGTFINCIYFSFG